MLRIATLWDPVKQRTAAASLVFFDVKHIEKSAALGQRSTSFLKKAEETWLAERIERAGQIEQ